MSLYKLPKKKSKFRYDYKMSKFRLIFNKFPKYTSVQELQRNKKDVTVHVVAFVIIPVLVYTHLNQGYGKCIMTLRAMFVRLTIIKLAAL
jgi:hypothetical protein